MAKVVLDANVIISAAFGGRPLEAVTMALANHEVYLTESVAQELFGVLRRLSKKLPQEQTIFLEDKMRELVAMARMVSVSCSVTLSRDPSYDHYLSLCKETEAAFLVTGDKDLLRIDSESLRKKGILTRIVIPDDFLSEE